MSMAYNLNNIRIRWWQAEEPLNVVLFPLIGGKTFKPHNMNYYSWSAPIERLMIWQTNNWMKYESKCANSFLRLHYDQLLITSDSKVLESLNLNNKIKGIHKNDVLILFVSMSGKEIRKIKFQLKTNVAQCLQKLGVYFPITSYNGSKSSIPSNYRNINEVLKSALAPLNNPQQVNANITLPPEYSSFIRLCLLDPNFPQVVKETEKVLNEFYRK